MSTPELDPFRENADLIRAFEERPSQGGLQVPERVLFDLEETRTAALGVRKRGHRERSFISRQGAWLRLAAVLAVAGIATWLILPAPMRTARVVVTAPGDVISETRPTIAWSSKDPPGQRYDVWILPEGGSHLTAPALFVAKGVTSPVVFSRMQPGKDQTASELNPGTDYRVLVCLADEGRKAGVPIPFKVKPLVSR